MPLYDFQCLACGWGEEVQLPIKKRDSVRFCPTIACAGANRPLVRQLAAPLGRIAGKPVQGGGADRFTADMIGVPLKELPPGLRQDKGLTPRKR